MEMVLKGLGGDSMMMCFYTSGEFEDDSGCFEGLMVSEIMLSNRLPEAIEWRWRCSSAVQGIYETELYIDGTDH